MGKEYLEAGRIVRPHGVRGEMVLEPWADSPEFLQRPGRFWLDGEGRQDAGLLASRVHKGRLLIRLRGVDTVEQAEALRGRVLYLKKTDVPLPEGKYFLQDLIGLAVLDDETGQRYGVISDVLQGSANDVYCVRDEAGKEYLFPAVPHMIASVDLAAGEIKVLPIPGIFDDERVDA